MSHTSSRRKSARSRQQAVRCPTDGNDLPLFEDLYRTYFQFVWSSAHYAGVDDSEMDDVVQEIFITIHGRLETLQKPESLRSWIYGITRRVASTHRRSKRTLLITSDPEKLEPELLQPQRSSPLQHAELSEQTDLLEQLLRELDPQKREVIIMAELHEMSAPDIALALSIPLNTVYSRLRAARLELEESFHRHNVRTRWQTRACVGQ